jgi:hypothetical protein
MDFSKCTKNFNYVTINMHHKMLQYFHRTAVWTFLTRCFEHSHVNIKMYLAVLFFWALKTAYFCNIQRELVRKHK